MFNLDGSISLANFRSRLASLPKMQEIIFYCARLADASAVCQAAKYPAEGLTNIKAPQGGVEVESCRLPNGRVNSVSEPL